MLRDFYDHVDIYDKSGNYKHTVSVHYSDKLHYYSYLNRKLYEYESCLNLSERCFSKHNISNKSHHLSSMSWYRDYNGYGYYGYHNLNDYHTNEKMSDYYIEKE